MKSRYTIDHYMWYAALALTVILALCKVHFWYTPIILYFIAEILTVFILAIFKGKVRQLPQIVKKAAKQAAKQATNR